MRKPGDLIGFSGDSPVSDAINLGTFGLPRWGISHVGIMAEATDGRLLLFESTTLDGLPCEIKGKPFNGTRAHDLDRVLGSYRGKVWAYPLYRSLFDPERQRLTQFLMGTIGVPYDEMGAFRAAGSGLSWFESLFHAENLQSIFCSEWCAKALSEIGVMPTENAGRWNPNHLIRHLRRREILLKPERLK